MKRDPLTELVEELAKAQGVSSRTIRRHLKALDEAGYLLYGPDGLPQLKPPTDSEEGT